MMYADTKKMRETAREGLEGMAGATNDASQRTAGAMNDNMRAFAEMSSALTSGVQELSREWWSATQNRLRTNLELFNKQAGLAAPSCKGTGSDPERRRRDRKARN